MCRSRRTLLLVRDHIPRSVNISSFHRSKPCFFAEVDLIIDNKISYVSNRVYLSLLVNQSLTFFRSNIGYNVLSSVFVYLQKQ